MATTVRDQLQRILGDAYVIERELAPGGMSRLFLASEQSLDRQVVIKILPPELASEVSAARFQREIMLTAHLQHPHILPILSAGARDGLLYYITPFVAGESLRHRLARESQLSIDDALSILRELADALAFAHAEGVVHRDLKPENVLLQHGHAVLADFGVARAVEEATQSERLTGSGLGVGTPGYMAPEQLAGDANVDARADVYALAVIGYEILAGIPPFTGVTPQALVAAQFSQIPRPLSTLRPDTPPRVCAAIKQALAKAPENRFDSAVEFASALADRFETIEEFAEPLEQPASRSHRSSSVSVLLGAGAAVIALASLGFWLRSGRVPAPITARQLTFNGKVDQPALSPDGKSVVYVSEGRSLVAQSLAGGEPVVLVPHARLIAEPRWTAGGSEIVFGMFRDSTELAATYVVPSGGGPARKVAEGILSMDASTDSAALVRFPREKNQIDFLDIRTGKVQRAIALPDTLNAGGHDVAWSPDRRFLAFTAHFVLWTISANGGEPHRIGSGRNPVWSAKSDAVYFLDGRPGAEALFRTPISHRSGAPDGIGQRVASLPLATAFDIRGTRLVYSLEKVSAHARALRFDGVPPRIVEERVLTKGSSLVRSVAISPDGKQVAFAEDRGDERILRIAPFNGGPIRSLTSAPARACCPSWSPDGSRVAYTRSDSGPLRLVVGDLSSGASQRVGSIAGPSNPGGGPGMASWSADGRHIAYIAQDLQRIVLVDLDRQTEQTVRVPDSIGTGYHRVVPSPDGSEVIVSTLLREVDWGQIWLVNLDRSEWKRLREPFGESYPIAWRPDGWAYFLGTTAQFTDFGDSLTALWRMHTPNGQPQPLLSIPDGCIDITFSRDFKRAACWSYKSESDLFVANEVQP